jgi:hypothetical protein
MEERTFEILHFSARYPRRITDPPKYPYFVHNLVWRAIDPEFKSLCIGMTEEWQRTEVVFDTKLADEYIDGLDFSCIEIENQFGFGECKIIHRDGIRRDAVYHQGWQRQFPFVYYIEKFDCFRAWGYTECSPITQACIHEIQMLQRSEHMYLGRFAPWSHFRRVISCLDSFWD